VLKKLNETLHQTRLRLLSLEQLQQQVDAVLKAEEVDDDALDALTAEVLRRLAEETDPYDRSKLQALAIRLVEQKLTRDIGPEERVDLENLAERLSRSRFHSRSVGSPLCMCSVPD
jgi:hypothetical protein